MSSKLSYRPLNESKKEIRLLKIVSKDEDRIVCELEHACLDYNPRFTALSYVWGDDTITQDITVSGTTFAATTNLVAALSNVYKAWSYSIPLRDPNTLRLWVDAICINQNDYAEKSSQVQLMTSIYQCAEVVLGWLGPDDPELEYGLDILMLLFNETRDLSEDQLSNLNWMKKHPSLCLRGTDSKDRILGNRAWNSVSAIFHKPYWSRVWILQEIALAERLAFFTTSRVIGVGVFEPVFEVWQKVRSVVSSPAFRAPAGFDDPVLLFLSGNHWGWSVLHRILAGKMAVQCSKSWENQIASQANGWGISFFGGSLKATHPKDHIYGLLALSGIGLKPDYDPKTTVGEVYVDYIASWLRLCARHHKDSTPFEDYVYKPKLCFLADSGIGSFENKLNLPTWVPNFPESQLDANGLLVDAHADSNVFPTSVRLPHVKGLALIVEGIHIDTLASKSGAAEAWWIDGTMVAYLINFSCRNELYRKRNLTALQVIISIYKMESPKMETTERDLSYALHSLRTIIRSAFSVTMGTFESLLILGIDWGSFNVDFMSAVGTNYSGPQRDWRKAFVDDWAGVKAEFGPGVLGMVLDDFSKLGVSDKIFF